MKAKVAPLAPSFAPPGTTLVERLGVGSVFEVALVRDDLDRIVVAKRVAPHAKGVGGERALEREREILRAAIDVHLPRIETWGTDASGEYIVQARARGVAVRQLLPSSEGAPGLEASRWLELARASALALSALHASADAKGDLGFVHGDLSPDNLFFEAPEGVMLVDLSSATWRPARLPIFPHDRGTLPYAAPELVRQEVTASRASDTYALAATLLAAAVGAITRTTTEASRLLEVATEGVLWSRLSDRSDLPARARSAISEALRFDPAERLSSSRELAERLE